MIGTFNGLIGIFNGLIGIFSGLIGIFSAVIGTCNGLTGTFPVTWHPCVFSQAVAYARAQLPCVMPAQDSLLSADRGVYLYGIHYVTASEMLMSTPSQYQGEVGNYCFRAQHWLSEQSGDGSLVPSLPHCSSSVLVNGESWEVKQRHSCISRPFSL